MPLTLLCTEDSLMPLEARLPGVHMGKGITGHLFLGLCREAILSVSVVVTAGNPRASILLLHCC